MEIKLFTNKNKCIIKNVKIDSKMEKKKFYEKVSDDWNEYGQNRTTETQQTYPEKSPGQNQI